MSKADVSMICDVAELSSLFEKSSNLDDFLQAVVSTVAWHMKAAVCSILIYDEETRLLTLRATQGLSPNAVGQVQVHLGEGLTGLALKEMRPVREARGAENPHFLHIKGINEERYQAFLAVPIRRGLTRVGVLVVEDTEVGYFDEKDELALKAIAAQLATVIENASLLLTLHRQERPMTTAAREVPKMIKGRPASGGVAQGRTAVIISGRGGSFRVPVGIPQNMTVQDFNRALQQTEQQIKDLQRRVDEELSDVAQLIFNAHLLILADEEFSGDIRRRIEAGTPPAEALVAAVNHYIEVFSASASPRLQEKVHDLKDLGHRLLGNLTGGGDHKQGDYSGQIIVADMLMPSDILKLVVEKAEGFIVQGGVTSHNAIICRSLQKPMVMIDSQQMEFLYNPCELLIDGDQGAIFIQPSEEVLKEYAECRRAAAELESAPPVKEETRTADGARVQLFANINLLSDLKMALSFRAEGVGLYRSEFPFIIRNAFPSEEEQYQVYCRIVETMGGREVTFRTLDIGGDKVLSYRNEEEEANPFLGLRAVRFSLMHKDIFAEQLRAFLRAGAGGNTRIMFPLIASLDEFLEAREVVRSCMKELEARGVPYNRDTKIGIMVELPSAVELIEDLAREVDFMSIGTNDLIQYMLAVDRTNERVSKLYLAHHPAILRAIERVISVANRHHKDVSICGDIVMDPKMIPFLLGAGITKLSMSPRRVYEIQRTIERVGMEKAVHTARQMLAASRISEVESIINNYEFEF